MTKPGVAVAAVAIALVGGVYLLAALQPDTFRIERSASIKAPPDKIFPYLNDFHRWTVWSPWEKMDPGMTRTYGPASSGKGALYSWDGSGKVGRGSMQIVESVPPSKLTLALDFARPMEAHNVVDFTLQPEGDATKVTWKMAGETPFAGKIFHLFVDMDKMVGNDFDTGLANLKAAAEK
jgi:uncharacterized protein YndB with AHSA1/START domain